jgi:hypothetical protein
LKVGAGFGGGGRKTMKIPFLLMLVSVFAAFSYMPVRQEPEATQRCCPNPFPVDA